MECMELKICMSDKHHRYYKHTKFRQNPRGDPKFLVDLTWNDPSLSYQLLFTSAKLIFLFVFYIGFQVLVVSWACLFYSEGVFGVDITHFCQ